MKKKLWYLGLLLCLFFSASLRADVTDMISSEDDYPILQNRFRIDSSIKQAAFMIYRMKRSSPIVLVDPDGYKIHPWDTPDNIAWYTEDGLDIVIIEQPKPGPWQALGSVSKKNKIRIMSDVRLNVEQFPEHFYKDEVFKFTAKLTEAGEPVQIYDFIERVKLGVEFTAVIGTKIDAESKALEKKKESIFQRGKVIIGEFEDNGADYDEVAGDGTFTAEMNLNVEPGKYEVNILSQNGVFLRAVQQTVLVYPAPYAIDFQVGKNLDVSVLRFIPYAIDVIPSSLAVHIDVRDPMGDITPIEVVAEPSDDPMVKQDLIVPFPKPLVYGSYSWSGWLYGTDTNNREFVIKLNDHKYTVINHIDLAKAEAAKLEEIKKRKEEKRQQLIAEQEAKEKLIMWIVGISVGVLLIVIIVVFIIMRRRKKSLELGEIDLENAVLLPDEEEKK